MAKRPTQADVARRCRLDQGSVSRILDQDARRSFSHETVRRVFRVAREMGYLHDSLIATNRRASIRKKANLAGRVSILIGTSTIYDEGMVDIDEISLSGMLLGNFRTTKGTLPMDRVKLNVVITEGKLKGFQARCKIARFMDYEHGFAVAVKFDSISDEARGKLKNYINTRSMRA